MNDRARSISTDWYAPPKKKSSHLEFITKAPPIQQGVTEDVLRSVLKDFKEEILQQVCDELDRIESRLAEIAERS